MKTIIYGYGTFAKQMLHYLKTDTDNQVVAFCVDDHFETPTVFCELPVIKSSLLLAKYNIDEHQILLAVGYANMRARVNMFESVRDLGYKTLNYIHSSVFIDQSVNIGENNIILPGTIIEPHSVIGNNNILWSSVNISHDAIIGSHNFIATKTTIGGFSKVNENCFLGFSSVVSDNIEVRSETLLGANSCLLVDSQKYGKYLGSPAVLKNSHEKKGIIFK